MKNIFKISLVLGVVAMLAVAVPKLTEAAVIITEYYSDLKGVTMKTTDKPQEALYLSGQVAEYGATVMVNKLSKSGSANMCETQFHYRYPLNSSFTVEGYVIHNYRTDGYVSTDTYGYANKIAVYGTYKVLVTNNPSYVKSNEKLTNFQSFTANHIYGILRSIKG